MKPIPVDLVHVAVHGALVDMAGREYRTLDEQAAWLIVEGLKREGYLSENRDEWPSHLTKAKEERDNG